MRTVTAPGLRLVAVCGLAMLGSGGAGAEAPRDAVQELVLKQVGTSPTVCARFKYDFIRGNKPTADEFRALETCITDAWRRRQPFYFSIEGTGVDSHIGHGLMGNADRQVKRFWYDSAPCGGPGCNERFLVAVCPV
jgi:hypothetical protein